MFQFTSIIFCPWSKLLGLEDHVVITLGKLTLFTFTFSFRLYPSASRGDSNVCRLPGEWLVEATSREPQQCQPRSHSISFSVFLLLSSQIVWCYRPWELVAMGTFLLDVQTTLLAVVLYAVGLMLLLPWQFTYSSSVHPSAKWVPGHRQFICIAY